MRQLTGLLHSHTAVFLLTWTVAVGYLALSADRGWIPHDEGLLGQSAERVLSGELPHRDFDDTYTGGLAMLHAAAFRVLGVHLLALRWTLLAFSAVFVAAFYAIAARLAPPLLAGLATWTAVAWSLPIYFAALPSWYNLFFATFGTLALLRHFETGGRRWLFAAGLCGGLSCLIKPIGLYFVAAALLALTYREQLETRAARPGPARSRAFQLLTGAALVLFCVLLAGLVARTPRTMELLHFVLPGAALCAFLLWHEDRLATGGFGERAARLVRLAWPFAAGVVLPVAAFLVPYAAGGDVGRLLHGVFVLPQQRWRFATTPLPEPWTLLAALPAAALLLVPLLRPLPRRAAWTAVAAVLAAAVLAFGDRDPAYLGVWYSLRPLVPIAALAGCALLVLDGRSPEPRLTDLRRQQLFLLLAMASLLSLVQTPDAFGVYFAYAAPPLVLALLCLVRAQRGAGGGLHAVALGLYLLFPLLWAHGSLVKTQGVKHWPVTLDTRLEVARGGVKMPRRMAIAYAELVRQIEAHSADGAFIYATPDCPEVYFLSGRKNPTRTFFDFFEDDYFTDPEGRARRILALLEEKRIDLVVLKPSSQFSVNIPQTLVEEIFVRYPHQARALPYTLHWREADGGERNRENPS